MTSKILSLAFIVLFIGGSFTARAGGSDTQEFEVNGLRVIFKKSPKDVISARLFIEGGAANYTKAKEGVESLTLSLAMNGGTKNLDKVAFNSAAEGIGTSFGSSSSYDYANMSMTCIKMFWDKSWNLFADAIMNPAFDVKEFKLLQDKMITAAKSGESDPDEHLRNMAMTFAFAGTNNEKIPSGTAESLAGITLEDVKNHYGKILGKKRIFLVVVGNVDRDDLEQKIKESLAKLPQGTPAPKETRKLITEGGKYVENRDIATNYIRGVMSAPLISDDDGFAMRLGMSILGDRFFEELRTKRSLSYAPAAFYSTGVISNPYNVIYISTQKPKESMEVMTDIINDIKSNGFKDSELVNKKQTFLTHYFMGQETSSSQSLTLGMAEIAGSWTIADQFTDKVNAVTLRDLNRVFDMYTKAIKWVYLGKQDDVKDEDFKQTVEVKSKPY